MRYSRSWLRVPFYFLLAILVVSVSSTKSTGAQEDAPEGADIEIADDAKVSEMNGIVSSQHQAAQMIALFVQSMKENAGRDNDTVKILCIDDKLTQIAALQKGIDSRIGVLESAISANDSAGAKHQFTILQVSFNKLNGLRSQADACVGNADIVVGKTSSEVSITSEDITAEEATTPEQEIFTPEPVVRPSVASGFR